jgi:hypothetical protein
VPGGPTARTTHFVNTTVWKHDRQGSIVVGRDNTDGDEIARESAWGLGESVMRIRGYGGMGEVDVQRVMHISQELFFWDEELSKRL